MGKGKYKKMKNFKGYERLIRSAREEINRIIRNYKPDKVIIFGSFAKGDIHEGSDLYLIVIKNTSEKFLERIDKAMESIKGRIGIDILVYTPSGIDRRNDLINATLF